MIARWMLCVYRKRRPSGRIWNVEGKPGTSREAEDEDFYLPDENQDTETPVPGQQTMRSGVV